MDFYRHLNYSLGNEDWSVEEQALRIKPGDKVVCVTASGDRSLHLLMTRCAEIISLDMNPIQNYLLNLKLAAISQLDYEKYIAFLGCKETPHRKAIFSEIRPYLSKDAANFWDKHEKMIQKGVIYQGRVEKLTHYAAVFFNLFMNKKTQTLLSFTDINEQRTYLNNTWNSLYLRKIFEIFAHPTRSKYLLNDPGFNGYTDFSNKPGNYIYQRMIDYLNTNLARKSPLFQLVFTGKILPEAYFPYLSFTGYEKIRVNISRLHYKTGNIIDFLNENNNAIDCFSLSDIASYMPQEKFEKLLHGIVKSAKPNARFCLREFISKRTIPSNIATYLKRDTQLEKKLESEESNFVYRFMAGEVKK